MVAGGVVAERVSGGMGSGGYVLHGGNPGDGAWVK